jgi:hypothetical protein
MTAILFVIARIAVIAAGPDSALRKTVFSSAEVTGAVALRVGQGPRL